MSSADPYAQSVHALLRSCAGWIDRRLFPGCAIAVGSGSGTTQLFAAGRLTYDPQSPSVDPSTWFDLASLTKPIATTSAALLAVAAGVLDLDAPLQLFFPEIRSHGAFVRHLLCHSSGLPAHRPFFRTCTTSQQVLDQILDIPNEYEPGSKSVYSDIGFILLGKIVERVYGEPFRQIIEKRVLAELEIEKIRFGPVTLQNVAPTEFDVQLQRALQGTVHDENARLFDGAAPHAGLFGTLEGVAQFAGRILQAVVTGGDAVLPAALLRRWTVRQAAGISSWGLGWDTATPESSAGPSLGPRSFGHTGFTGTSIWIDPEQERFVCILSNRVHPTRNNEGIKEARRSLNGLALAAYSSSFWNSGL